MSAAWQNQQNDCIRAVWSLSSLSAWRKLGSLATNWAHNLDSDQTERMPRPIWVFAGRKVILLVLSWGGSCYLLQITSCVFPCSCSSSRWQKRYVVCWEILLWLFHDFFINILQPRKKRMYRSPRSLTLKDRSPPLAQRERVVSRQPTSCEQLFKPY